MNNNLNMIFGAPGCGKTTYLIKLLEDILTRYPPSKIAFVSFTRKGSYEGRDRAREKFGYREEDFPYFRTIHSLAFRDLGMTKYEMISKRMYKKFSEAMGMNFVGYYTEDFINNDDKYLFYHSLKRNNPGRAEKYSHQLDVRKVKYVSKNYEEFKKFAGIKDFDDLIEEFNKKDQALPVEVAIIDEAQDLTSLQWEFCKIAFKNCKEIYIAGDDDQAIYEWNGSDVNYFLSLTDKSKVTILDKSYRLKSNILNYSNSVSKLISNRVVKDVKPVGEGGKINFVSSIKEIPINSEETYYFLCRNTYFLSSFKSYLKDLGLVFDYKGKRSVDVALYRNIKLYEEVRQKDPGSLNIPNYYTSYLKKDCRLGDPWFDVFELSVEDNLYYRDIFRNKTDVSKCNLDVSTIHGVKGGEADNVILKLNITKAVLESLEGTQRNFNAELRCLYVALTRAKKNLYILHSNSKFGYDKIFKNIKEGHYE